MHWNSGIKPFLKERSHKYSQTTQFLHFPAIPRRRYELDQVKGNHQQGDLIQVEAMEGRGFTLFSCFCVRPPAGRGWQRAGISVRKIASHATGINFRVLKPKSWQQWISGTLLKVKACVAGCKLATRGSNDQIYERASMTTQPAASTRIAIRRYCTYQF
jgi:hypothetical protein